MSTRDYDKDIYLYAKGHYVHNDILTDLRILIGKRCGLPSDCVSLDSCIRILINLVWPHLDMAKAYGYGYHLYEFLMDLDPANCWKVNCTSKHYVYHEAIIYKCLSVLRNTLIADIPGGLPEPDPSVLPVAP